MRRTIILLAVAAALVAVGVNAQTGTPPSVPVASAPTGSETWIVRQDGVRKVLTLGAYGAWIRAQIPAGPKGDQGTVGPTGATGAPKRVERYTATTNASGVATFTFSPAFAAPPDVEVITTWSGSGSNIQVNGVVGAVTASGASATGKVSTGAVVVALAPFATAGAGVPITIRAIGN